MPIYICVSSLPHAITHYLHDEVDKAELKIEALLFSKEKDLKEFVSRLQFLFI